MPPAATRTAVQVREEEERLGADINGQRGGHSTVTLSALTANLAPSLC
jgi:hypothetical protein